MARVIVLGAGTGGMAGAYEIREKLGSQHTVSVINEREDFQFVPSNPGPVVVGAMPGASCYGPAYEYAFILDKELRNNKVRDRVPMIYVTPEPYIGHLGLGGVGDSKSMMETELRNRHIRWITNAKVTKVAEGTMYVDELNEDGSLKKQHKLLFKHSMMLPAFVGVDAVLGVEGLVNPKGFVIVDEHQRNPTFNKDSAEFPHLLGGGMNAVQALACWLMKPLHCSPLLVL